MRTPIILLLSLAAIFLSACGDLILFNQKIEGSDPISLQGRYIWSFEDENGEVVSDTLDFHRLLPHQFIVYSSQTDVKDHILFQGEIHQRGSHYFLQKQDPKSGKWKIEAFKLGNGSSKNLVSALYTKDYDEYWKKWIKEGKVGLIRESKREIQEEGRTSYTQDVYEVDANERKTLRLWKKIIRKSDKLAIMKLGETEKAGQEIEAREGIPATPLLYPNPSSTLVNIQMPFEGNWNLSLLDLQGQRIKNLAFNGKERQIDISDLPRGIYHLQVRESQNEYQKTWRLIKE